MEIENFRRDRLHRIWIALAEDGLSLPIKVPVVIARVILSKVQGIKPGPVVGITAALHGNELNGIPLIHRLFTELNTS